MRLLMTGATGFVGRRLVKALVVRGDTVLALTRSILSASSREVAASGGVEFVEWSGPWRERLGEVDAVVNLAGEPVVGRRWSSEQKERLRDSRIGTTRTLVEAMQAAPRPPAVFVSASAVGYYGGRRGDEPLDEDAAAGDDFLARLCVDWEAEAERAREVTRTVVLRLGIVLGDDGGSLAELVRPFRFGVGGPIGSGRQWVSWIHLEDVVRLVLHALDRRDVRGVLNACAPEPVRQGALAAAIGRTLHRQSWLPVPRFALRLALGEMSGMLVEGQRVVPKQTLASGFAFRHPDLEESLATLLA